jgi:quercetin dioxygenase-like cupin family protein
VDGTSAFDELQAIAPQALAAGWLARVVQGGELTFAVVEAARGAVLPEHDHRNEQLGMVVEGSVRFRIGDEQRSLGPGGVWRIPPHTPHTVTAGEAGAVVIDVFSPPRDDWAGLERGEPRQPAWP